jgi:hypothetical protein
MLFGTLGKAVLDNALASLQTLNGRPTYRSGHILSNIPTPGQTTPAVVLLFAFIAFTTC